MQPQLRMPCGGIFHDAGVGDDHRVDFEFRCAIDCALRALPACKLRKRIEREKHLPFSLMRVAHAFARRSGVEIQPGKVARIGVVAKAHVNAVGAVIDGDFERGQATRRTHQIHDRDTPKVMQAPRFAARAGQTLMMPALFVNAFDMHQINGAVAAASGAKFRRGAPRMSKTAAPVH